MITEGIRAQIQTDQLLRSLPQAGACAFVLALGSDQTLVSVHDKSVSVSSDVDINHVWDFTLTIPQDAWRKFCSPNPPPRYNTMQALVALLGPDIVQGDRTKWAQYAEVVERVMEILARRTDMSPAAATLPDASEVVGRYCTITVDDTKYRIYYESAGTGYPLICLHTAGSDARQYKYLLEDEELLKYCRVIAFDLPWHGKSNPPDDWRYRTYELTVDFYSSVILNFSEAIGANQPLLAGSSMGGAICLYMASRFPNNFRGVFAIEGGFGNPSRRVNWTGHAEVDHSQFLMTWVEGLMSPHSPRELRDQVLWEYAQGGPGIYRGDGYFYSVELPRLAAELKPAGCPLYVFSGDYDYSATPEMSEEAAATMGGEFIRMHNKGHFPMSEDPEGFMEYFLPAIKDVLNH